MTYETIRVEHEGDVAVLTLNDPATLNAMGLQMAAEIREAAWELSNPEPKARCLLLTGEGRAFCSGANLSGTGGGEFTSRDSQDALRRFYHPALMALRDLPMPIVSAVHGPAAGVGMSFALMADMVCASKEGYFLQAFARIGLIPDGGATYLLPRLVGPRRAAELSMLADKLFAEQALEWGLINRVFDDREALMAGARELATRLAQGPRSLVMMREAFWKTFENTYEQQLELEAKLQAQAGRTADALEGRNAFLEKRTAQFQGQ
ncbi:MAG: enoyl-CoA hydratase-related protein [Acidobacteriota bacterium]